MSKTVKISILLLLLAGVFSPFFAGDDKIDGDKKKTRVSADNFTYKIVKGEAVYEGEVFVDDPQIDIFADKMTIIFVKGKPKEKEKPKLVDNPPAKNGEKTPANRSNSIDILTVFDISYCWHKPIFHY
jgi:lipopolysaccharide export system protein LptA